MVWQRDRSDNRRKSFGDHRHDDFGGYGFEQRPTRSAEPPRRAVVEHANVTATVKWFNPAKGFGFVSPTNGVADAFLHISALTRAGHQDIAEGATVVCDLGQGQRGPQVINIHSVDTSTATADSGMGAASDSARPRRAPTQLIGEDVEGTVKFFSADKGFGFVALDDGGKDVFVHVKVLERSGLRTLQPEQRVRMTVSMGQKGPQAESVNLI